MALTTEQIDVLYMRNGLGKFHLPAAPLQYEYDHCIHDFARAIEAEVRKQDDELVRQMHDAMSNLTTLCLSGGSPLFTAEFDRLIEANTAARARLGEKT